jgi:hypothetical protein
MNVNEPKFIGYVLDRIDLWTFENPTSGFRKPKSIIELRTENRAVRYQRADCRRS